MPKVTSDRIILTQRDREEFIDTSVNLTPEKLVSILQTARDGEPMRLFKLSEEIYRKDPDIFQSVQTRTSNVTNLDWVIEGAPKVEDYLRNMRGSSPDGIKDFSQFIASLVGSTYLTGVRVNELLYDDSAQLIGFNQIPSYFLTYKDQFYMPKLWTQASQDAGVQFSREKVIVHYHDITVEDYTQGALVQSLAWLYLFRTTLFKAQLSFSERYGKPFLLIQVEGQGDGYDKDLDNARRVIQGLGIPGGVFRDGVNMEFISSGTSASDGSFFEISLRDIKKSIQKVVLGQTSSADSEDSNRSTAQEHMKILEKYRRDDAAGIENTINDQLLPVLGTILNVDTSAARFQFQIDEAQEEEDTDDGDTDDTFDSGSSEQREASPERA